MRYFIFLILLFHASISNAYDPNTHRETSLAALTRTELVTSPDLLQNLGLDPNIINNIFPNSFGDNRNIFELVLDGAEFEDAEGTPIPNDTETYRMKHHFYDPQNNGRPLTVPVFGEIGLSSYDWILLETANIQLADQNFSYSDANTSLYRALTSLTLDERSTNWGLTFQTLGQVIHHIQDMSQPQHTRNDSHLPWERPEIRFYESYTEEKRVDPKRGLNYLGYPDVDLNVFNTARSFWGSIDGGDRKGMAWFSSSNFVSAGTNFTGGTLSGNTIINVGTHENYDLPSTNSISVTTESITNASLLGPPGPDQPLTGDIQFVGTQVTDSNINSESRQNSRTSSFSIFDYDLQELNFDRKFTLNRFNYDAAHEFLIPRAASYSAGLINYFFRGRISAQITADGDGIEITNASNGGVADVASPTTFQAGGTFEVFYESSSGERKPLLSLSNLTLGSNLPVNGTHKITGLLSALQDVTEPCDKRKVIILFDGGIGSERGLSVTNVKATQRRSLAHYINTYTWGGWDPTDWVNPSRTDISNTEGTDLADCGSKYYMFAASSGGPPYRVYQFDLNPVNTVLRPVYTKTFNPGLLNRGHMRMSDDGKHMILETSDVLYKYTLTIPFDVSTAEFSDQTFSPGLRVSGFDTNVGGTKMYIATTSGDYIIEYSMNPAWNFASLSPTGSAMSVLNVMGSRNISDVKMSTSGTMMLTIGEGESSNYDKVYKYDLTTAFDLSTASFSEALTTIVFSDESRSIAGEALEDLFIVWEFGDNTIYQYNAP